MKSTNETVIRYGSKTKNRIMNLVILLVLLLCAVVMLTPVFIMVSTSLKAGNEIFVTPPRWFPEKAQFSNYVDLFAKLDFLKFFKNSLFVAFFVVVGTLVSSSLVAFGFFRYKARGKGVLFLIVISTLMIPYPALMIPQFVLFNNLHWIETYLPLIVPTFFGSAYMIFLLRQFFSSISNELFDAARIDGCGEFRCYWNIALPLSKTALAVVAIFSFLWNWDDLLAPIIYLGGSPDKFTLPVMLSSLTAKFRLPPWNLLMAAATVSALPCIALFVFCQRYFVEGIVTTGIKG